MPDHGRTIAITGAGSGIGKALSSRFAQAGYRVAVTDLDQARATRVLEELSDNGGTGFAQRLDVTSQADWDVLCQRVLSEWGGLKVLVNNAGVAAAGRLEDTPMDDWKWILETNLVGVVRGCHRFLPILRAQGGGHVVNVASYAGMMSAPELSAYGTAKSAVVALSEQLRVDLEGSGVGITLVCPAYVQTRLLETFRSPDPRHREVAERWMGRSRIGAAQVAEQVFDAVARGRFLVLTHGETKWLWRLRRWFPERYFRIMVSMAERMKRKMS